MKYICRPIICVFCYMKNGYWPCYKHPPWVSLYVHFSVVLLHEDKHYSFKPFAVSTVLKKIKHQTSLNALCPWKPWITFVVILQELHVHAHTFIILLLIFIGKYAVTCNIFVINFFFKVNTSLIISRLNQVRVSVHC